MSQNYWENRYQTKDMPWEKGEASPGLVDFLAAHPQSQMAVSGALTPTLSHPMGEGELSRGTVCVPGGGTGHDAVEWAKAGFKTFGFDIAPSAIKLSTERAQAAGLTAQFQLADFLGDEPPFQFDWLFEHTLFCAIDPGERDNYVRAVQRWLKPGGQYLAVNYMIPDTDGPPFGTTREELWERFSPHFDLLKEWVPRSYPNRTGLELMLWWKRKAQ